MENNELNYQGLILDENTVSESDYIIWGENDYNIPENTNKKKHFYNQWKLKRTRNWCWLYWSAWAISDLTWYEFSEEEMLDITNLAESKYWRKEDWWMYMSRAVDCLRNWWNTKFPNDKLISFRLKIWDEKSTEALKKNHSLVIWYRTSSAYYKDSQDNWVIDWEDFSKNWWHLVRCNIGDKAIHIDDNYFWKKKYNTYINNKLWKLVNKGIFFPSAYLFLKDNTMKDKIRDNIDIPKAIEAMDKWFWNWLNPRQSMSRQEVVTVILRAIEK